MTAEAVQKPYDYGSLGSYRATAVTGTMAAGLGADSEIWQFRYNTSNQLALIHAVRVDYLNVLGTAFTAGIGNLRLTVARSFSVAGTGGGTLTLSGNNNKMRTSMATASVQEIRVATTAALGAGTKTLDANDMGRLRFNVPGTDINRVIIGEGGVFATAQSASGGQPGMLWSQDLAGGGIVHPIALTSGEGLIVRANVPATGTWEAAITVTWTETAGF